MIPVQLKIFNFTSYGTYVPTLDFTGFKLACLSGYNGAGKSSILDAITWCLWGTSRAGDNADKLVRVGQKEMSVEFSFELENTVYKIIRKRLLKGTGSTSLEFFAKKSLGADLSAKSKEKQTSTIQGSWLNLTEGTIRATQEKIIQTLHMTYEVFVNSSYLRQGNADEFTLKGATERKRILADILGLSNYDRLEEKAKERIKAIANKTSSLDYQIIEIEAELSQKDNHQLELTQAETKLKEIEIQRTSMEEEIKALQKQKEDLMIIEQSRQSLSEALRKSKAERDEIINQGKDRAERIKNIEELLGKKDEVEKNLAELARLEEENKAFSAKQTEILALTTQKATLSAKVASASKQAENLTREIKEIGSKIEKMKTDIALCPMCGSVLDLNHRQEVLGKLEKELKEKEDLLKETGAAQEIKQLEEIEKKISLINYDGAKHQELRQKIILLEPSRGQKEKIATLSGQLKAEIKAKKELAEIYQKKEAQIKIDEKSFNKLPDVSVTLAEATVNLKTKESAIESFKLEENEARAILGKAKQLVERSTQLESLREQKIREKNNLSDEKTNYEELSLAFGKKGIQAMIIETAIPEIEEEANNLLEKLTEGRMKAAFETQREAKSGGTIETLDIILSDEMGARSYEMYSGGESFRANFAIRLALSKLLTHRAGAKLQFLVIDEGFGTQDTQGRDRLVEAINLIKDDFEKILVVTHIEELKEAFPCRIEVVKNNNGSTFEILS
ncbi:MAG: SMC family ATPase [Patescibacteria group bacterium]|nr:SMC family ATPase [Patescibacteria group bacterium]